MKINNASDLKFRRKGLRNHSTPAESTLWLLLKNKQVEGRKFRRQHSIGPYILDFYCPSENLAVELDGEQQYTEEGKERDAIRKRYIEKLGITVIRFENFVVFDHPELIIEEIRKSFGKM